MGLRQQMIRRVVRAVLLGTAPAVAATGCATFAGLSKDMHELVAQTAPSQVSYMPCTWQNRLTTLPDPLRNGAPTPGIVGQVYFYDAGYQPVDPAGELTVVVSDATPRPPGQAGPPAEAWHFTNATLKNLRLMDERIGRCHVVFLPWPATWRDVTKVRFQARYDQPNNGPTLYAKEAEVALDFTPGPDGLIPGTGGGGSIPNPTEMLKQARAAQVAGRTTQSRNMTPPGGVQPAGYSPAGTWGPPAGYYPQPQGPVYPAVGTYPPAGYYGPPPGYSAPQAGAVPQQYGPPTAAGGVQPAVVPFRPPGTELATPGPPEIRTQYP